jgi:nicotinate phosphoribosyltransferase
MGQLVFKHFRDVPVRYTFKNRTKGVLLGKHILEEDLRWELDHVRTLGINNSEYHYLRGIYEYSDKMFSDDYLQFLKNLRLPDYDLRYSADDFSLEFSGKWSEAIYWETLALSIINQLYYNSLLDNFSNFELDTVMAEGKIRLAKKIDILKQNPDITFTDFGTRRRFAWGWQRYVVYVLQKELSEVQFRGTSNTRMAMDYGLVPMGTSAHELFMVMAGIMHKSDEDIYRSHNEVLKYWWREYGYGLSIALTDTYGSDFFFRDMSREQAAAWKGLRQDSGDPIEFGEKAIKFYKDYGLDPRDKLIVFSDGLDIEAMMKIHNYFRGRIKTTFGWGTNLTNDLRFKPLSLVVKATEACGHGLVKLSDNLAKATGRSEDIEKFKRIFGYAGDNFQECKY